MRFCSSSILSESGSGMGIATMREKSANSTSRPKVSLYIVKDQAEAAEVWWV
jgi:hypothetical protein